MRLPQSPTGVGAGTQDVTPRRGVKPGLQRHWFETGSNVAFVAQVTTQPLTATVWPEAIRLSASFSPARSLVTPGPTGCGPAEGQSAGQRQPGSPHVQPTVWSTHQSW